MHDPYADPVVKLATAIEKCLIGLAVAVGEFRESYANSSQPEAFVMPAAFKAAKPDPNRLLDSREVAEMIGLHENTLRRKRSQGEDTPSCIMIGRFPRYRLSDVEAWLKAHERKPVKK